MLSLKQVDLKKKIGQMMVVGFDGKVVPQQMKEFIHEYHIGAFILFGRNIGTPSEILSLTVELQREAKKAGYEYPLLICTDQENGVVRRLGEGATMFPGAMALGATGNSSNAEKIGYATGIELKALGINWNLAPVVDVNNNPENPVIGVRSFGESPELVSEFGSSLMTGMQQAGVATTLKHFPGHGDTNIDSHLDLPTISHPIGRLEDVELKPFRECILKGADTVMTAHVYFPAIEDQVGVPATLSKKVITGLLREKLGFQGVVTTDCLEMNAISQTIGVERGAVEAVKAGVDLLMVSHQYAWQLTTINEVIRAVENGEIDERMIDAALERIAKLKATYVNWNDISLDKDLVVPSVVGSKAHKSLAEEVYKQSVTIVKERDLPIRGDQRILVLYPEKNRTMMVEDQRYSSFDLGAVVKEFQPLAEVYSFSNELTQERIDELTRLASRYEIIIFGTLTALPGSCQIRLMECLHEKGCNVHVIAMRSPYDLQYVPDVPVYINTYEFSYPALRAAVGALFGKTNVTGTLPVTVKVGK